MYFDIDEVAMVPVPVLDSIWWTSRALNFWVSGGPGSRGFVRLQAAPKMGRCDLLGLSTCRSDVG